MTFRQVVSTSDPKSLEEFRNAAAGLIKSLLRARIVQEPRFLTPAERRRWKVEDADGETRSCASLLTKVKQLNEQFQLRFMTGLDSVPAPDAAAAEEQLECLLGQVAGFIFGDIDVAIEQATRNNPVGWVSLADWSSLATMRDTLDKVTQDRAVESPAKRVSVDVPKAIVYIDGKPEPLNGSDKIKKRLAEFFQELVEADGEWVNKSSFEVKSEHIQKQPQALVQLVDSRTGAGTRIPRDQLYHLP